MSLPSSVYRTAHLNDFQDFFSGGNALGGYQSIIHRWTDGTVSMLKNVMRHKKKNKKNTGNEFLLV
jgi:hypothetical protein